MSVVNLDTSTLDYTSKISLPTQTVITMYIIHKTGTHLNHRVALEFSPDGGTTWVTETSHLGLGCKSYTIAATDVRVRTIEVEGAASTVDVHVVAK